MQTNLVLREMEPSSKVEFPPWYFYITSHQPPSKKMIYTLKICRRWEVMRPMVPYGPIDINGSFNGLLNRELIGIRKVNMIKDTIVTWYVTERGKMLLKQIA
jgi:hypothetical protein